MRTPSRHNRLATVFLALSLSLATASCSTAAIGPGKPWRESPRIEAPLSPEVAAPADPAPPRDSLRVVTFNVHFAEDVDAIARAFREDPELALADVIFVQEIRGYPGEGGSRASRLARALGMGYAYAPAKEVDDGTHGLAILSRFPLERVSVMELPRAELILATERRIALSAEIETPSGRVRLVNVHLDTRINAETRIAQLEPALRRGADRMIVAGDFNTNPARWAFNLIPVSAGYWNDQAPLLDEYMRRQGMRAPTSGFGPTVPKYPKLKVRLDSIYLRGLSSGAGAVERDVNVSDHWPVWLDVMVAEAPASGEPATAGAGSSGRPTASGRRPGAGAAEAPRDS